MLVIHLVTLPKIFEKGGIKETWKGYVPVYNYIVWLKLIGKPWWWIFFGIVPLVNLIVMVALHVETARKFNKFTPKDTILSILIPWYYIPFLAFKDVNQITNEPVQWQKKEYKEKRFLHDHITLFFIAPFVGHAVLLVFKLIGSKQREGKGSMEYEWTNAIGFAVVAATIIRVFFFEAFTIPTGSMEKTMRIGDYLFVNKMKYGARSPMTPLSVPFIHNRIPGTFMKSYVEWMKFSYFRLPGYGDMERGDIMVFNWPVGDSVLLHPNVVAHDYYAIVRDEAIVPYVIQGKVQTKEDFLPIADKAIALKRNDLLNGAGLIHKYTNDVEISSTKGIQTLTLDKKENYVKRCVGIHGDELSIVNGVIYIDGQAQEMPAEAQFMYKLYSNQGIPMSAETLDEKFGLYNQDVYLDFNNGVTMLSATKDVITQIQNTNVYDSIIPQFQDLGYNYVAEGRYCPIYPNHPKYDWTRDNFGPIVIPEEGMTVELTEDNWILYKRVIQAYEGNESAVEKADGIYINGEKSTSYTFKQNYYWMMGDNRHGSVDSRYWGFVGEDHIVGTASFIWMSKHPEKGWFSGGLRWDRVFSFVE